MIVLDLVKFDNMSVQQGRTCLFSISYAWLYYRYENRLYMLEKWLSIMPLLILNYMILFSIVLCFMVILNLVFALLKSLFAVRPCCNSRS